MPDGSGSGFASPFLAIPPGEWIASNRSGYAVWDRYPVSQGHALVISHRLIPTWWEGTSEERADLLALVDDVKARIDAAHAPDGYDVGFNAGEAAGQTVGPHPRHPALRRRRARPPRRDPSRHSGPRELSAPSPAVPPGAEPAAALRLYDGLDGSFKLELVRCLLNPAYDRADLVEQNGQHHRPADGHGDTGGDAAGAGARTARPTSTPAAIMTGGGQERKPPRRWQQQRQPEQHCAGDLASLPATKNLHNVPHAGTQW